ncbi:MAG: ABC transporter substrate-binding protein [Hyphomicrobiales bacterium]
MTALVHAARIALAALMLILGAAAAQAAPPCKASAFVTNAGRAMIGAARTKSPAAFSGVAARYTDMRAIAIFALGQHRGLLPKSREKEYVALTHVFVGRTLARNSSRFRATDLKVTDCSGSGKAVTVNARLSGGQRLVFKLYKTRRGYRVRDVNVASVWLAQQLRSNFAAVIRRGGGGIETLFAYLRN